MIALFTVLALLALIAMIPLHVFLSYGKNGFTATAQIAAYKLQIYPNNKKKDPKKQRRVSLDLSFSEWLKRAKLALHAVGKLRRSATVENFELKALSASDDPFDAVKKFGVMSAAAYSLLPLLEAAFKVKKSSIQLGTDFDSVSSTVEGEILLSLRIWQFIGIVISTALAFWQEYIVHIKERKRKYGKQTERNDAADLRGHQKPC